MLVRSLARIVILDWGEIFCKVPISRVIVHVVFGPDFHFSGFRVWNEAAGAADATREAPRAVVACRIR